jgi:hypothetical protein
MGFIEDDQKCMAIKNMDMKKRQELMKKYSISSNQNLDNKEYNDFIKILYCKQTALQNIMNHLASIPTDNHPDINNQLHTVSKTLDEIDNNLKKISIKK